MIKARHHWRPVLLFSLSLALASPFSELVNSLDEQTETVFWCESLAAVQQRLQSIGVPLPVQVLKNAGMQWDEPFYALVQHPGMQLVVPFNGDKDSFLEHFGEPDENQQWHHDQFSFELRDDKVHFFMKMSLPTSKSKKLGPPPPVESSVLEHVRGEGGCMIYLRANDKKGPVHLAAHLPLQGGPATVAILTNTDLQALRPSKKAPPVVSSGTKPMGVVSIDIPFTTMMKLLKEMPENTKFNADNPLLGVLSEVNEALPFAPGMAIGMYGTQKPQFALVIKMKKQMSVKKADKTLKKHFKKSELFTREGRGLYQLGDNGKASYFGIYDGHLVFADTPTIRADITGGGSETWFGPKDAGLHERSAVAFSASQVQAGQQMGLSLGVSGTGKVLAIEADLQIPPAILAMAMGGIMAKAKQQAFMKAPAPPEEATVVAMSEISQRIEIYTLRKPGIPDHYLDLYEDETPPTDGWGREIMYAVPGPNGFPFELISLGSDGAEGGTGSAADIFFSEQ